MNELETPNEESKMEVKQVRYSNPPLVETVFELRFPTILKIDTETPDKFQDLIRQRYPGYEVQNEIQQQIVGNVNQNQFSAETKLSSNIVHVFSSVDKRNVVKLARNNIFYSTTNYLGWDRFKEESVFVMKHFADNYQISHFSRIGLRYINVIDRTELSLDGSTPWETLVKNYYLGLLANPTESKNIESYELVTGLKFGAKTAINLRVTLLVNLNSQETCLGLDNDCFLPDGDEDFQATIESLHKYCEYYFLDAITEELRSAMKPLEDT